MSVTQDILATWRGPGRVIRRLLEGGMREDKVVYLTLITCVLIFVAQMPYQSREAHLDPQIPLSARLYWSGLFFVFILPFFVYFLAALSHLIARLIGGRGTWMGARLALVWALLALTPLTLLMGMIAGFVGAGPGLTLVSVLWVALLAWFWFGGFVSAEYPSVSKG